MWPFHWLDNGLVAFYASFVDATALGQEIRKWRDKIGWTQAKLAAKAGVSPSSMSALETRGQGLDRDTFLRLCELMGADPVALADRAHFHFRHELGQEVERLKAGRSQEAGDGRSAVPSFDEITRLYDAATAAHRSFFLVLLRILYRDIAESAYLQEILQDDADLAPEPPKARASRPKPHRRARDSS